jgi:hypothetical protein
MFEFIGMAVVAGLIALGITTLMNFIFEYVVPSMGVVSNNSNGHQIKYVKEPYYRSGCLSGPRSTQQ